VIAKLICGVIRAKDCNIEEVIKKLEETFGPMDLKSEKLPFNFTDYYEKEMGTELKREWTSFKNLIQADDLRDIKLTTIEIENKFRRYNGTRTVNLDPGYITLSNLVLATTKNYSHRIYLGAKIYAEVTLIYKNHHFRSLEWTYPDYKKNTSFFEEVRNKFKSQIPSTK
jgi:hypothetical protein